MILAPDINTLSLWSVSRVTGHHVCSIPQKIFDDVTGSRLINRGEERHFHVSSFLRAGNLAANCLGDGFLHPRVRVFRENC